MDTNVTTGEENDPSSKLREAVLATTALDEAWNLIRASWRRVTPEFVQALFQTSAEPVVLATLWRQQAC